MKRKSDTTTLVITAVIISPIIAFSVLISALADYNPKPEDLGDGFMYFEEQQFISFYNEEDSLSTDIPPYILSYWNNSGVILIKQHPKKYDDVMYTHYDYPSGRDTTYYWFIEKRNKIITGPILYSDMEQHLRERGMEGLGDLIR